MDNITGAYYGDKLTPDMDNTMAELRKNVMRLLFAGNVVQKGTTPEDLLESLWFDNLIDFIQSEIKAAEQRGAKETAKEIIQWVEKIAMPPKSAGWENEKRSINLRALQDLIRSKMGENEKH